MLETFVEKEFRAETLEVIRTCVEVLDEYAADGYDLTLRQLYYQMISRDLFPECWVDPGGPCDKTMALEPDTVDVCPAHARFIRAKAGKEAVR